MTWLVRGRPLTVSSRRISSRTVPNGLRPAMHNVIGPVRALAGHSTYFTKLYRYEALTRFSSETSCTRTGSGVSSSAANATNCLTSEPESSADPDGSLELHPGRHHRAKFGMVVVEQVL